jgi:hypothetical protein
VRRREGGREEGRGREGGREGGRKGCRGCREVKRKFKSDGGDSIRT